MKNMKWHRIVVCCVDIRNPPKLWKNVFGTFVENMGLAMGDGMRIYTGKGQYKWKSAIICTREHYLSSHWFR